MVEALDMKFKALKAIDDEMTKCYELQAKLRRDGDHEGAMAMWKEVDALSRAWEAVMTL